MFDNAERPTLGAVTAGYAGVALVTLGTVLTLSVVLVACSFFRKYRSGTNDSSSQTAPGIYVAESYANPAFLELPFDGSCTSSADVPYETPVPITVSVHTTTNWTASTVPTNVSETSPKSVVAKITGPMPYQAVPEYSVQSNAHAVSPKDEVHSVLSCEGKRTPHDDVMGGQGDFPRPHEQVSTDIVYANLGAKESFKETQPGGDVSGDANISQTGNDITSTSKHSPPSVIHAEEYSNSVIRDGIDPTETSELEDSDMREKGSSSRKGEGLSVGPMEQNPGMGKQRTAATGHGNHLREASGHGNHHSDMRIQRIEAEVHGSIGTSAKRVRASRDSLVTQQENGTNQHQRKKPKMSPETDAVTSPRELSPGKNKVRRKGSRNSFSRVRKVVFHPRRSFSRKKQQKVESAAEVVIQNPSVSG